MSAAPKKWVSPDGVPSDLKGVVTSAEKLRTIMDAKRAIEEANRQREAERKVAEEKAKAVTMEKSLNSLRDQIYNDRYLRKA